MRTFGLAIGAVIIMTAQAAAAETRFERSLQMLAPTERLQQICDYAAMKHINDARNGLHPDRAVGDATSRTILSQDTIEAKGAAFRSRHKWYALSYTCTASLDHMKVLSFKYNVGPAIPEDKWASYGLWR